MKPTGRIAVIDCGTNTFHLLIGESAHGKFHFLHRSKRVVKIGTKSDPFGPIPKEALNRAFSVLVSFRTTLKQFQANRLIITGTAALRDSMNGKSFLEKVKRELGFSIHLIPGELEAELIYQGVRKAIRMDERCSLIMDIGGGSTEFILCNADGIFWKKSYRLGAARLNAWWSPSDPPTTSDIKRLNRLLAAELADLIRVCQSHVPENLIGASGSFETLAALMYRGMGKNTPRSNELEIPYRAYRLIHDRLILSNQTQRLQMPGMLRMRADMMVPASLLISFVLKNTGIRHLRLSRFALKEGLFFEAIKPNKQRPVISPQPFH